MKAQTEHITYRKKFNLGNYENEDIEITVSPGKGQSPDECLAEVQEWVEERATALRDSRNLAKKVRYLQSNANEAENYLNSLTDTLDGVKEKMRSLFNPTPKTEDTLPLDEDDREDCEDEFEY